MLTLSRFACLLFLGALLASGAAVAGPSGPTTPGYDQAPISTH